MNTFDISVIVWVAVITTIMFFLRDSRSPTTRCDRFVAVGAAIGFLIPVAPLSWLALTGIAIHILRTSQVGSLLHRGGWIILAVTLPMFWSRVLFSLLSDSILSLDAILVSWILGTDRTGNAIEFADGSGYLWIAPACSSIANVSLAMLCSVLFAQLYGCERPLGRAGWAALACLAVVAINVIRLSLIGFYSEENELLHGAIGKTLVNWITFGTIIGICALGARRDLIARG
jgi:exosortase/archaeosortase family protein